MSEVRFSFAKPEDEREIRELLTLVELPDEDIGPHLSHFIVAKSAGRLLGCVGLELTGDAALLRSLAVVPEFQSRGTGAELCRRITEHARERGFRTLYLMTTSAADYFRKLGYEVLDRNEAPAGIRQSRQFRELCPSTASVMKAAI